MKWVKMSRKSLRVTLLVITIIFLSIGYIDSNPYGGSKYHYLNEVDHMENLHTSFENDWAEDGVIVCSSDGWQRNQKICSDGSGGAIIVWEDERGGDYDIYAQKIDENGNVLWTPNGTVICLENQDQNQLEICSDGSGGVIIVWKDDRGGISDSDIYAQKIDTYGNIQWTPNGTEICTKNQNQNFPSICSDGLGGAIIVWHDERNLPDHDLYAQRIDANGSILWGVSQKRIPYIHDDKYHPKTTTDGMGGAIITWTDAYGGSSSGSDNIYAQRINPNGDAQWHLDGIPICTSNGGQSTGFASICSVGSGGAIIVWRDYRNANWDIFSQKIDASGVIQWGPNGTAICTENYDQNYPELISDLTGGAIIVWMDRRGGGTSDIYLQKIDVSGDIQWDNGTAICTAINDQERPSLVGDGIGGAIISWQDHRYAEDDPSGDIFAQVLDNDGNIKAASNGQVVCNAIADDKFSVVSTTDGDGGAIISWRQWYDAEFIMGDIYAQRLTNDIINPVVEIQSPQENNLFGHSAPSFVLDITEESIDSRWYSIDTTSFSFTGTTGVIDETLWDDQPSGIVTIDFYVNDTNGNQGVSTVHVEKDITLPVITINSPGPNQEFRSTPSFDIDVDESNPDSMWYTINGGEIKSISSETGLIDEIIWKNLDAGPVTIRFYANDTLGNINWKDVYVIKAIPSGAPFDIWNIIIIGIIIISIAVAISLVIVRRGIKGRGIRVFISHAVKDFDKYQIGDLVKYLESQKGISKAHYCEVDMVGNIDDWMDKTVPRSQLLIIFFTENSVESKDCIKELSLAFRHNVQIMPILGENMKWEDLEKKLEVFNISREFGKEFDSEDFGRFREELYEYVMRVKKDLEEEIGEKKRKSKAKKLK